jgi:uncharacterized membrane protein
MWSVIKAGADRGVAIWIVLVAFFTVWSTVANWGEGSFGYVLLSSFFGWAYVATIFSPVWLALGLLAEAGIRVVRRRGRRTLTAASGRRVGSDGH